MGLDWRREMLDAGRRVAPRASTKDKREPPPLPQSLFHSRARAELCGAVSRGAAEGDLPKRSSCHTRECRRGVPMKRQLLAQGISRDLNSGSSSLAQTIVAQIFGRRSPTRRSATRDAGALEPAHAIFEPRIYHFSFARSRETRVYTAVTIATRSLFIRQRRLIESLRHRIRSGPARRSQRERVGIAAFAAMRLPPKIPHAVPALVWRNPCDSQACRPRSCMAGFARRGGCAEIRSKQAISYSALVATFRPVVASCGFRRLLLPFPMTSPNLRRH